jgi:anti-sigma-K factor RskA
VVSSIGPVDLVHLVNTVQVNDRELVSAAMAGASAAAAAKKGPAEFNFGWRTLAVLAVIALVMVTAALFAARDRDESPGPQRITAAEASGPLIFGEHEIKLVIKPRPAATP